MDVVVVVGRRDGVLLISLMIVGVVVMWIVMKLCSMRFILGVEWWFYLWV